MEDCPIRRAIEEAFGEPIGPPSENQKEASRIMEEIVEGLNALFKKRDVGLLAKRDGDTIWALGSCSLYGAKHLIMKVSVTSNDEIFFEDGSGDYKYCTTGDNAQAWVVNYFKSKKSGALALRSIMCMATRIEKEKD